MSAAAEIRPLFPNVCRSLRMAVLALTALLSLAAAAQSPDLVLVNGMLLDGAGNPWRRADVAVRDGRIVAVGRVPAAAGGRRVDVSGLIVAPGFIDTHSHAGVGLDTPERSPAEPLLAQGITTVVVNPDGGGPVDMVAQRQALEADGLGVNVAQLVPHGSLRRVVVGLNDRAPSDAELERMRSLVREAMAAGAFGLSSGLFYAPASFASNDEVLALAREVAPFDGVYQSHVRDESNYTIGLKAAVAEVIDIARQADIPGVVTHIKALGPPVWGDSAAVVDMIREAREEGVQVFTDQYPYPASATGLGAALLPLWANDGGIEAVRRRLDDIAQRARLRADMEANMARRGGADRLQIRRFEPDPSIEGRRLDELAQEAEQSPVAYAAELLRQGQPGVVSYNMREDDLLRFMVQPWNMTASDGSLPEWGVGVPHPRAYGSFPRKIRTYVLEQGTLGLADAVRSMTSLPAAVYRIPHRGLIAPGQIADIVVFDLERLRDRATFTEPHQLSEGVVHVLLGGEFALRDGRLGERRLGAVLRREAAPKP